MILPSQLNISLCFMAVPIWQWEPAEPAPADTPEGVAPGEPVPASSRLVFKGYEWQPTAQWEFMSVPEYERWVDSRSDDSVERCRRNERSRSGVSARPPLVRPIDE